VARASRLGWTPSHPAFGRNPLDLSDDSERAGLTPADYVVRELREGRLTFAAQDPDDPANWPRVLTVRRANLLGSSGKGMEYFMRHLLGTHDAVRAEESPENLRPAEVTWREEAPGGKLDLLTMIDFRMTSTCTFADVVLPAATWYEKHDLSSTDMHTRSCTRSTRRFPRRGRPVPTSRRSPRSPRTSPGWPRSTSEGAPT
jgi:nitrate reductase alpha subunit